MLLQLKICNANYGHGLLFFLAPVGFQIPPNSDEGFLGLFNTTTSDLSRNQIIAVEFDSFSNEEWDPPFQHVCINNNSTSSVTFGRWNASFHSGDTAKPWITYNATTRNLTVSWSYETNPVSERNSSLSYGIDLMDVLPEWVTVGFSAATGVNVERHTVLSWEFNSSLNVKGGTGKKEKRVRIIVGVTVPAGVLALLAVGIITFATLWKQKQRRETAETTNLTSMNDDDLERGTGPRRFSYGDLVSATSNF